MPFKRSHLSENTVQNLATAVCAKAFLALRPALNHHQYRWLESCCDDG